MGNPYTCTTAGVATWLNLRFASTDADSHDDFKPKYAAPTASSIEDQIKQAITSDAVHVFMKVSSGFPRYHAPLGLRCVRLC